MPAQKLKQFLDSKHIKDEQIAFNAGTHTELVRLAYKDFQSSVEPTVAKFAKSV